MKKYKVFTRDNKEIQTNKPLKRLGNRLTFKHKGYIWVVSFGYGNLWINEKMDFNIHCRDWEKVKGKRPRHINNYWQEDPKDYKNIDELYKWAIEKIDKNIVNWDNRD